MREKYLVTDPNDAPITPKTLESFLSQKRTSQTGFILAVRYNAIAQIMWMWFSNKWSSRLFMEFPEIMTPSKVLTDSSWRSHISHMMSEHEWRALLEQFRLRGYIITPVRSFRRFTR